MTGDVLDDVFDEFWMPLDDVLDNVGDILDEVG